MDKYDKLINISVFGAILGIVAFIFTGACGLVTVASLLVGVSSIANVFLALTKVSFGVFALIIVGVVILLVVTTIMRLVEK